MKEDGTWQEGETDFHGTLLRITLPTQLPKTAAAQRDAHALYELGCFYMNGKLIPKDAEKAIPYFRQAAELGDAAAQCMLAECYRSGDGINADVPLAIHWYTLAADNGHSGAQYELGLCYMNGDGVWPDLEKAAEYLAMVADQGIEEAAKALEWVRGDEDCMYDCERFES